MDAIVDTYNSGSGSAAVSVMTSDNLKSYSSDNASYSMSAAGLYLPPWLAYYDVVGGSPSGGYQSVLSSMDNGKANELIDRDGGMDMLNSWLNAHDYDETRFGHLYGDVNASENGYDNTTSSDDAAKMLTQLITKGEDGLLNYNMASDGVALYLMVQRCMHIAAWASVTPTITTWWFPMARRKSSWWCSLKARPRSRRHL